MLKVTQSRAKHNPCKDIFNLAASAYSPHDLVAESILERWWQAHPNLFYLAYQNESLCGYISAFPLTTKAFQTTLKPNFDEKTLEPSDLLQFKAPTNYQLYFSSIVVHSKFRRKGVSRRLRQAFLTRLLELWDAGFCVKQASALVVSPKGASMMQSLGFQAHSKTQQGSLFYAQYDKSKLLECLKKLS